MARRPPRHLRVTRDLVLFASGLAGAAYEIIEVVSTHTRADPALLAFFGGLLGLPLYLRRDEAQQGDEKKDDDPPASSNGSHRP